MKLIAGVAVVLIGTAACGGGSGGSDSAAAKLTACSAIKSQLAVSGKAVAAAIRTNGQDPAALTSSTAAAFTDGSKKIEAAVASLSSDDQVRMQAEKLGAFFAATAATISNNGTTLTGLESLVSNPEPKEISTQLKADCQP